MTPDRLAAYQREEEFFDRTGVSPEYAQEFADQLGLPLSEVVPKLEAFHAAWEAREEQLSTYLRQVWELAQEADQRTAFVHVFCKRCKRGKHPVAFVVASPLGPLLVSNREPYRSHPTERREATLSEWKSLTGTRHAGYARVGHIIGGPNTHAHSFPWDTDTDQIPAVWCPRHELIVVETRLLLPSVTTRRSSVSV